MRAVFGLILVCLSAMPLASQDFSALARLNSKKSSILANRNTIAVALHLSQSVPFRAFTLADPPRLVLDFREVDFAGTQPDDLISGTQLSLRFGAVRPGWSRLVLAMTEPYAMQEASMSVAPSDGTAKLVVTLSAADLDTFKTSSGPPSDAGWALEAPLPKTAARQSDHITLVIDPGHGGIDPGASSGGVTEADLMLTLAQELREALVRAGDYTVVLTRQDDSFVSLERRVQIARQAGATAFVSLHADALASGKANGASVYTLSDEASDKASAALAERHDREDLLAGVDLSGQDDTIAKVLMDLARLDNGPRSDDLARGIILGINTEVGHTYKRPIQRAGFSVLKAADIPSVLVEVGFLSSSDDLTKLTDPQWRGKMVAGIRNGIQAWLLNDAANARLRRK